ncbi:MAG: DUF512 domain-containing protein [Calditrichales bacterium]|nr:MAG: DUF512 domain-containing protein [Calditrichales bacterium]
MLEIIHIEDDSIAAEIGLKPGDKVVKVNDHLVKDQIDFRYYSAEEKIELLVQRDTEQFIYEIEKDYNEDIGIDLEAMKMKACGNNCVFCFVYQNPRGMRKAVYFKDEDYRFSFLYGHYVTLTRLKEEELQRIVSQQLSPLYISVHATEEKTRKLLLGINRDDHLFEKIDFLVKGGIELHAQIVLCPGINDGKIFDKTVADLKSYYPGVRSIAVVPVGLTRHREQLYDLRIHTPEELQKMIDYTDEMRARLYKELEDNFVYLSDEFYIKAGQPLPPADYYDAFYQIENGVGEFRDMINRFKEDFATSDKKLSTPVKITWVTGTLAAGNLEKHIISKLRKVENLTIDLVPVKNDFYGHSIEVSGLLVGKDIHDHLKNIDLGDYVFLPPRVLNHDHLFLDDWSVQKIEESLNVPVIVYDGAVGKIVEFIREMRESK